MNNKAFFGKLVPLITAAILVMSFAGCGDKTVENNVTDSGNAKNVETDASKLNNKITAPTTSEPTAKTYVLPSIPSSQIKPALDTQLISAMAILPQKTLDKPDAGPMDSILIYSNLGKLAKRFGIKKGGVPADKQEFLMVAPMIFYNLSPAPENPIEEAANWYWSASNPSSGSFWLAGNISLDTALLPAIRDLKYEKNMFEDTGLAAYVQKADGMNPKYGKAIVPLGRDLCYFNLMPNNPSLGNETFKNLNIEKGLGLLGKDTFKNMFSLCGDPDQMLLFSPTKRASSVLAGVPDKLRKQVSETLKNIEGMERHPGLLAVSVCIDQTQAKPMRFVFCYENIDLLEEDFPKLASIWGKAGKEQMDWSKSLPLAEPAFSKSLNCGIIECKLDAKQRVSSVIPTIGMLVQSGMMPELWLR